ncbi:MAG: YbaK/EbsC family protein [Anaerolineales bacterium]|nr:YbaK/EbsC family protein [Anaerolineales bacterium]
MFAPLSPSAQKVQQALQALGLTLQVVELPDSTRTAVEAAQAVGCQVGQIVKSLVFKTKRSQRPLLVIASGSNRVDEKLIEARLGEPLGKADAEFVRQQTGFAIGGVPPLGHASPLLTFIDQDLLQYERVWAAAGTPHAVFELNPGDLPRLTGGEILPIH